MSISDKMARFTLDHTDDPNVAAACAAQLGWRVSEASPKVSFPPQWVLSQKVDGTKMAFYVTHCDDPDALDIIAKRDTRKLVREALVKNPNLPLSSRNVLNATAPALKETSDTVTGTPLERLEALMRTSVAKRYRNYGCVKEIVTLLDATMEIFDDGPDLAIAFLAEHNFAEEVLKYLLVSYGQSPSKDNGFFVWDRVTLLPVDVLAKMDVRSRKWVLNNFIERVAQPGAFSSHIGPDLAAVLIRDAKPRSGRPDTQNRPRAIFAPEAVDLLVEHPKWSSVLARQILSDEQFFRLLENTPLRRRGELACALHARYDRLVGLMKSSDNSCYFVQNGLEAVLECITDPDDAIIDWVTQRCDPYQVANYMLGGWYGGVGKDRIELWPSPARVAKMAKFIDRTMVFTLAQYLTNKNGDPLPEMPIIEAMLEHVSGLAYLTTDNRLTGEYTYSRLVGCGGSIEVALEQFESQGQSATLEKLCRTISTLAREAK